MRISSCDSTSMRCDESTNRGSFTCTAPAPIRLEIEMKLFQIKELFLNLIFSPLYLIKVTLTVHIEVPPTRPPLQSPRGTVADLDNLNRQKVVCCWVIQPAKETVLVWAVFRAALLAVLFDMWHQPWFSDPVQSARTVTGRSLLIGWLEKPWFPHWLSDSQRIHADLFQCPKTHLHLYEKRERKRCMQEKENPVAFPLCNVKVWVPCENLAQMNHGGRNSVCW